MRRQVEQHFMALKERCPQNPIEGRTVQLDSLSFQCPHGLAIAVLDCAEFARIAVIGVRGRSLT